MSQGSLFIANGTGASVRTGVNNALTRLSTRASGIGRPVDIGVFEEWIETDNPGSGQVSVWQWDGTNDVLIGVINTTTHSFTAYTTTQPTGTNNSAAASTGFVKQEIQNTVVVSDRTGALKPTYASTPDTGWIMHNDGTIGNAGSGASNRAQTDTQALFSLFWNLGDAIAPLNSTRGASATADFVAGKTIRMPLLAGRNVGAAGNGAGLTARTMGSAVGAEGTTHHIEFTELPFGPNAYDLTRDVTQQPSGGFDFFRDFSYNGGPVAWSYKYFSGWNSFFIPTIPPTGYVNWMIKL